MNEEDIESPYCEVCGTCGYLGCCGIRNFIEEHIEGKTNCKNENIIIHELINLCDYKDEVFKENKQLNSIIKEVRKLVVKLKEDNTSYYDECLVDNFIRDSLEILDKADKDHK